MVVNLAHERLKRQGRRPFLPLIGAYSTADTLIQLALDHCFEEDREFLLKQALAGSYAQLLATLVAYFEVDQEAQSRAIG